MSSPEAAGDAPDESLAAQLAETRRELEQLSFSISHDLRAPLRAVDGYTRILLDEYADSLDDEGRKLLDKVGRNAITLGRQIDAILLYSRAGRRELQPVTLDMKALVQEVWQDLPAVQAVELQLDELPQAVADRSLVVDVLRELLDNAVKFSARTETPRITVSAVQDARGPSYQVADNGVGFDPAHADGLFTLFQRLHDPDEFPGLGAGLAIARRLIQHQGGWLQGQGEPGHGAQFRFGLPAQAPPP